jgi:hypothetical protein
MYIYGNEAAVSLVTFLMIIKPYQTLNLGACHKWGSDRGGGRQVEISKELDCTNNIKIQRRKLVHIWPRPFAKCSSSALHSP